MRMMIIIMMKVEEELLLLLDYLAIQALLPLASLSELLVYLYVFSMFLCSSF